MAAESKDVEMDIENQLQAVLFETEDADPFNQGVYVLDQRHQTSSHLNGQGWEVWEDGWEKGIDGSEWKRARADDDDEAKEDAPPPAKKQKEKQD